MKLHKFSNLQSSLSLIQIIVISIFIALLLDFIPDQDLDTLAVITQLLLHVHFAHLIPANLICIVMKMLIYLFQSLNYTTTISPIILSIVTFAIVVVYISLLLNSNATARKILISLSATIFIATLFQSTKEVYKAFLTVP